ncbi:MAG: ABC transporter permease [Gammaproteobacteria bacterium]|jgi:putative ABC transport system permease protein|nr:ABC transporter permease [Gammaproteobacteria bacterium]|tara:strand:- start:285 stop:980 length:696 start_codon:yes stop_codon:yes gene_type:complete
MNEVAIIPIANLLLGFLPVMLLIVVMKLWGLNALQPIYANFRMLIQLLLIGYVLTYIFETDQPVVILLVILFMILMSSWIALRPLQERGIKAFMVVIASLGLSGLAVLFLISQFIVELPRWFEPNFIIPIAGMIFANSMNTVSLAGERFSTEQERGKNYREARRIALETAMIPQINALLAVGLVSLPGMMTGQILSGIEPLTAARYQIMVMCMIFSTAGLSAVTYMSLKKS